MKKIFLLFTALILTLAIFAENGYAGIGTDFTTEYEISGASGSGEGSTFIIDNILLGSTEGTGTTFGTVSILSNICGDDILDPGEQCDDGASNSDIIPGACRTDCSFAVCGDGVLDPGEQCDGGLGAINSCSDIGINTGTPVCNLATCQVDGCIQVTVGSGSGGTGSGGPSGPGPTHQAAPDSECGNGIAEGDETCDDGNTENGDGCDSVCEIELPVECGNGVVEGAEQCDDGNLENDDGCSDICESELEQQCGNGQIEAGEQCDDGNLQNYDGCDAVCKLEPSITITMTVYPEKRLPSSGNWSNEYWVSLYETGTSNKVFTSQMSSGNNGVGQIVTTEVPNGAYDLRVKGQSHLSRFYGNIQIDGDTSIDTTNKLQRAGDVTGDNFINALDLSVLISNLYASNIITDLNRDGIVNALDLSITLSNLYQGGE